MMRRILALLALVCAVGMPVRAQTPRAALLQQASAASDNFETARAIELARAALDPALGAPDSVWVRGVHVLAQLLFENGNEPDAHTWARWGMRLNPTMPIDSVNFLSGVVGILRQARDSARVRTAGDELTKVVWQWPARGSTATQGIVRVDPSPMSVPLNITVTNATGTPVGQLIAGPGLTLAPGTYEISAAASGFIPVTIKREVLPGVTTTFAFQLAPSVLISGTISTGAREAVYKSTAAISVQRFGAAAPACAAGAVTGGRLLLTSYAAIRGADALAMTIGGQPVTGDLKVAAYDATSNLAVVLLPAARADSIAIAGQIVDRQAVWGVQLAQCRTLSDSRSAIDEWTQRPLGSLRLSDPIPSVAGAPVVDYLGRLAGISSGATTAIPAPTAAALIDLARRNVAAAQLMTVAEVARRENHVFGAVAVTADVPNATVKVTPLERWHWAELATSGTAPFNFAGAVGRYRLETSAPGLPSRTQEITILPGQTARVAIPLRTVAAGGAGQPAAAAKKGGMPKWVWIVALGGVGAAAAAAGGGGGGGGGASTGSLNLSIPVNPP